MWTYMHVYSYIYIYIYLYKYMHLHTYICTCFDLEIRTTCEILQRRLTRLQQQLKQQPVIQALTSELVAAREDVAPPPP
jgi:hypothetical protein